MKKIVTLFATILLILSVMSVALAADNGTTSDVSVAAATTENATQTTNETAPAITPDHQVLWGIKLAIENIDELLTFDKAAKAQKGLAHARERLLEVQAMIVQNKLDAAQRAQQAHSDELNSVEQTVNDLKESNSTTELKDELDLQNEVDDQEQQVNDFKLNVELNFKGNLTADQQAKIQALLASFANSTADVKVKIDEHKQRTKIEIKAKEGKTDKEVDDMEDELRANITHGIGEEVRELAQEQNASERGIGKEVEGLAQAQHEETQQPQKQESEESHGRTVSVSGSTGDVVAGQ